MNKRIISPTQITMYSRCGEQYRRRYIKKEIIPPAIALIKGSSFHRGSEYNFEQKIDSKKDLPLNQIREVAADAFDQIIKHEGVELSGDERSRGKPVVCGEAKDSTMKMLGIYRESVAPKYQPTAVECRQEIELKKSKYVLLGIIDLIDTLDRIVEFKTSGKKMDKQSVEKSVQMTFYGLSYKAKMKKDPVGLVLENVTERDYHTFPTDRKQEDYQRLINRINVNIDGIEKGNFPPAHDGAWWCSEKFCGYYPTCKVRA